MILAVPLQASPQRRTQKKNTSFELIIENHVLGPFHFHCTALVSVHVISDLDHCNSTKFHLANIYEPVQAHVLATLQ